MAIITFCLGVAAFLGLLAALTSRVGYAPGCGIAAATASVGRPAAGVEGMNENISAADSISVQPDGDPYTYVWHGQDAQQRHDQWALTGEETYDEAVPD